MAEKKYNISTRRVVASGRRAASSMTGTVVGSGVNSVMSGHEHANKDDLDRLGIKESYLYVDGKKVKSGYADKSGNAADAEHANEADHAGSAADLDPDSPVRAQFLSRISDDRAEGLIASDRGFEVGNYAAGAAGGFFSMDANGDSFAEVGRLWVRVKAFFEELTVVKSGVIAGKNYITPGGGVKCTKVEEVTDISGNVTGWRCYFLSEQDGEKTDCKFIAGDQAISEMFNAKTGTANKVSNHRYWRLVTAVSNDAYTDDAGNRYGYVELSATDCEDGSSVPVAGDEICQFGNRTDTDRQSAMVFSTVDADAPSVKLYGGIDSYTLDGRAVVAFGRDAMSGDVYFRLGASGAKQYLEYTQGDGLTVLGKISTLSTVGDKPLGEYVEETAKGEADKVAELMVSDLDVLYISHTSATDAPALPEVGADGAITDAKGWQTDAPQWQDGRYIWQTTYMLRGNGTASFSDPVCIQGAKGEDAVTVEIGTDFGNVIFNGEGSRTLTARVWRGNTEITESLPQNRYSWERTSANAADDAIWNRLHEGWGNTLTVTQEDVDRNALFTCCVAIGE